MPEVLVSVNQEKAKAIALRLITIRSRSKNEIQDRLKKYNFSGSAIKKTVAYLESIKIVDDAQFTKNWIQQRISKNFGLNRIKAELVQKGIASKTIDYEINFFKQQYSEIDTIKQLIKKKQKYYKGIAVALKKQRIYGYLIRKGFNQELVYTAIKQNF